MSGNHCGGMNRQDFSSRVVGGCNVRTVMYEDSLMLEAEFYHSALLLTMDVLLVQQKIIVLPL